MLIEYFVLEQDPYYKTSIKFPIQHYYKYDKSIQQSDYSGLSDFELILIEPSTYNLYPDVLSKQVFMVSQKVLDAILIFDSKMNYSTRYLMDNRNKVMNTYFIPHLQAIHCLPESNKKLGANRQSVKLDVRKILKGVHIFQIGGMDTNVVIVSLALLEAILRRIPEMVSYTRIESYEVKT